MREDDQMNGSPKRNFLKWLDDLFAYFIPNFNIRAILYLSAIFVVAASLQVWRISSQPEQKPIVETKETIIADKSYWDGNEYKEKLKNQTVGSFTKELQNWLEGKDQEFSKRRFEDMLYVNAGLDPSNLAILIPENFNYLENIARARYRYAKEKGFLADAPTLVRFGTLSCNIDEKTEQLTGTELYDWRYASMPKLVAFMQGKPDWKMRIGDRIFDVSDPRILNATLLKSRTPKTQPAGLFSILVFRDPKTNRITVADSAMLEKNGVDAKLTLDSIGKDKQPTLHFKAGYNGCTKLNTIPNVPYGDID